MIDEARDAAIEQVDDHADPDWKEVADLAVEHAAESLEYLTSEDVRRVIEDAWPGVFTHDLRALGPVMLRAARAGLIVKAGARNAEQYRHGALVQVWRSRVAAR